jgi:uncharacterized protein (TIGR03435 family)
LTYECVWYTLRVVMKFLFTTGLATVIVGAGLAQSTPDQPRFEIASVKASLPGEKIGIMDGGPLGPGPFNTGNHDPLRITWTNVRLIRVLMMAYDLPGDRISGPGWLGAETYDIVAPVPRGTSVADFKLMVQNLLADRFKLAVHREAKEVAGYSLEVAKTGLKVKESPKDPQPVTAEANSSKIDSSAKGSSPLMIVDSSGFPAPRPGNTVFPPGAGFSATIKVNDMYRATVLNQPMSSIADFLGTAAGAPVADHTGLAGIYDFHLEYKPSLLASAATGGGIEPLADIPAPAPDLFDAVQAQLGLKLVPRKVPRETLVIDHIEKIPTEN